MEHPGSPACPEMPYFPAFFKVFSTLWEGYLVPRRGTELGIKAAEIRCNQQRDTAETIIETITKFGKGWTISEADFWLQIRSRSQSQLFKLAGRKIADRVIIL